MVVKVISSELYKLITVPYRAYIYSRGVSILQRGIEKSNADETKEKRETLFTYTPQDTTEQSATIETEDTKSK